MKNKNKLILVSVTLFACVLCSESENEKVTESNIAKIGKNKPQINGKVVEVVNDPQADYLPVNNDSSKLFIGDIEPANGSSSDLEYETVQTGDLKFSQETGDLNSLGWLSNLYNPLFLRGFDSKKASKKCSQHMDRYLKALQKDEIWAIKMTDASGRYASQFFFGNQFWLGSKDLCTELSNPKTNKIIPPYPVGFWIIRLSVNLSDILTPQKRITYLGLCLPKACSGDDVSTILTSRENNSDVKGKYSVSVLNVRPVPGNYSVFKDRKFYILGGFILIVVTLIIIGSSYEYITECKKKRNGKDIYAIEIKYKESKDIENNNSEKKSSYEHKSKTNVYEVNKKEYNTEDKKSEKTNENNSGNSAEDTERHGVLAEILLSFSALSNSKKIVAVGNNSEDSLTSVHGLRFFSLAWVILVHTYLQLFAVGGNKLIRNVTERSFMYQTIGNATFSVDSFFFISGLLVSYLYFKNENRERDNDRPEKFAVTISKFLTIIVYRFIRLTPVYFVVLGMIQISMTFINNTSVFEPTILDHINCENYWWRNILYVNNMFPRREMCMLWSWYMATDTQFFVLSAMLLLAARKHFRFSAATLFIVLLSSWCTTAFISYTNQYEAKVQEPFALFDELYDKPWTRIGPYIVGMCAGWLLHQTNCKIKMSIPIVLLGWGATFACLLSIVYGLGDGLEVGPSAAYVALGHTAWGLALAWIVVACRIGYGGWVNSFLSCSLLHPLSRLTYCAYLVHPFIMVLTSYVMDGPFHIHNGLIVIIYLGNLVASYLLSFLLSLAFEAPIVRLLKLGMSGRKRR